MAKKAKKNGHKTFKTTNQGRREKNIEDIDVIFKLTLIVKFGMTFDRADEILSSFQERVNELAKRGLAETSSLKTIEVAALENAKSMSVNDAYEMADGFWVKEDDNGKPVQALVEDFDLVPPLTTKELDFFNWVMGKGVIQLMPVEDGDRSFMIGVINNYPESVILVKP